MLRILSVGNFGLPNNFDVDIDSCFEPGLIGQFKRGKDNKIICGVSEGIYTCGIIDDVKRPKDFMDSTLGSGKITVWNVKNMIAETDQFDSICYSFFQSINGNKTPLYCNKEGKLTPIVQSNWLRPIAEAVSFEPGTVSLRFKWLRKKF